MTSDAVVEFKRVGLGTGDAVADAAMAAARAELLQPAIAALLPADSRTLRLPGREPVRLFALRQDFAEASRLFVSQ